MSLAAATDIPVAPGQSSAAEMREAKPIFLVDVGGMYSIPDASSDRIAVRHLLDSPSRLLSCCELIRHTRPEAQTLAFLESTSYGRLMGSLHSGDIGAASLRSFQSGFQCVPFGCEVSTFLLEFASRRANGGAEVVIISNTVDIVLQSRAPGTRWRHLGFMFVENELILPGLQSPTPATITKSAPSSFRAAGSSSGRAAVRPVADRVRKAILKARSSTHLGGHNQLRSKSASGRAPKEELQSQETQQQDDTDLDGAAWQGESINAKSEAFAATQVIIDGSESTPSLDDVYADTQVDVDMTAPSHETRHVAVNNTTEAFFSLANAYAETQLDCEIVVPEMQRGKAPELPATSPTSGAAEDSPRASPTVVQEYIGEKEPPPTNAHAAEDAESRADGGEGNLVSEVAAAEGANSTTVIAEDL
jgi:hypothetical protein